MTSNLNQTADLQILKEKFSGGIIMSDDSGYEDRATTFLAKGEPAVIFQPKTSEDVGLAISYARQHDLVVSVRSGGHSMAGFATNDGGVIIDLKQINTIEVLDPAKRTVRIGAGAVWEEVSRTLAEHQLVISAGDTKSVGVGGLTLGGGIGWMVRKYGLAIDSLIGAEIVTADGEVLHVDETNHVDLFWAVRGGGGNFGVVTHFTFAAHPSDGTVYAGAIQYDIASLKPVLRGWRDYMRTASENLTTIVRLIPPLGPAPASLAIQVCYDGPEDEAKRNLEPLLQLEGVTANNTSVMPYVDFLEEAHRPPTPVKFLSNAAFLDELHDEALAAIVAASCKPGDPILQIRSLGGAMARVPVDDTAFAFRKSEVMIGAAMLLFSDDVTTALQPWEAIAHFANGVYGNFTSDRDEDITTIYPSATLKRLQEVKRRYDPQNFFHQNFNIEP